MPTINGGAINGSIDSTGSQAINTFVINGVVGLGESTPDVIFSGEIARFTELVSSQTQGQVVLMSEVVGVMTANEVVRFIESVELRLTTVGEVVRFTEEVTGTTSAQVCKFSEKVIDSTDTTFSFFNRNKWDFDIFIGNTEITHDMVHGPIHIVKAEDHSSTCSIVVLVDDPVTFIDNVYDGSKQVIIDYYNGVSVNRLITAIVDSPDIDIINKTVTLNCSQQRNELITAQMAGTVKTIGLYSDVVSGTFNGVADELNVRLKTVPESVDFDSYNRVNINSWYTKDTPDYTLTAANILYRAPKIDWQNRGDVVNSVNIQLDYKRTRLYHIQRGFSWTAPYFGNTADYFANRYTSPLIDTIDSAISNTSWQKIGDASYTQTYALLYNWLGLIYTSPVLQQLDNAGNPVNDPSGNPLYKGLTIPTTTTTTSTNKNVMQASFVAAKRFSQFITESYNITVQAPQSTAKNGVVTSNVNVNYEDTYDASPWESTAPTSPPPSGAVVDGSNFYFDLEGTAPSKLNNAILTAIAMARTSILATHRGTQVEIETQLLPTIELRHTVELSMERLGCIGRVVRIEHFLDTKDGANTTKITLALFRVPGSTSDTPWAIPTRPTFTPPNLSGGTVILGNHYGFDQKTTPGAGLWNGFIGNKAHFYHDNLGTNYFWYDAHTDEFRVDTPAIPDNLRSMVTLPTNVTYNISIPNNPLTIDTSL